MTALPHAAGAVAGHNAYKVGGADGQRVDADGALERSEYTTCANLEFLNWLCSAGHLEVMQRGSQTHLQRGGCDIVLDGTGLHPSVHWRGDTNGNSDRQWRRAARK